MSHEPVKVYVAAIIRNGRGVVLLTRHDSSSKWHFPDTVPTGGQSCRDALATALKNDLGIEAMVASEPCQLTEVIRNDILHLTLHYEVTFDPEAEIVCRKPMEYAWVHITKAPECYLSTRIVLERFRNVR